ncbi:MAG: hypothetical protein, partial [Olavius algarvensis Gamma 1 endosymbiont]
LSPSVAARPRRRIMRKANSSRWRSMITSVTSRPSHSVPGRPTVLTASG